MPVRRPEFELDIGGRVQPERQSTRFEARLELRDRLGVAPVEAFGKAKNASQHADGVATVLRQPAEFGVRLLGHGLSMVAGDKRDDRDLFRIEAPQASVRDQVVRMAVVPLVADVMTNVMQDGGILEPLAFGRPELMPGGRRIENHESQPPNLIDMRGVVAAALSQLDHTATPDVRVPLGGPDVGGIPPDVVQDQPLAQREVRQRNFGRAEMVDQRVQEDGADSGQVGTPRIQTGNRHTLGDRQRGQPLAQSMEVSRRHTQVSDVVGRTAAPDRQRAERADRARTTDDPFEAAGLELAKERSCLLADVAHEAALAPSRQWIRIAESLGQPERPELEAPGHVEPERGAQRDLRAASTDVDHDRSMTADANGVGRGHVDESGFLGARDHPNPDTDFAAGPANEVAAVLGLAHGTGRRGDDLLDSVGLGQALELDEALHRLGHRRRRKRSPSQAGGAQTYHVLLAIDDIERHVRPDAADDHVDRVASDVDGGDSHCLHGCYIGRGGSMSDATMCVLPDLTMAVERRAKALEASWRRARRGDVEAVHEARVISRRLRALLPLLAAGGTPVDESRRLLRRLGRALGHVRQLDVTREMLADAARRHEWPGACVAWVDRSLQAERRAALLAVSRTPHTRGLSAALDVADVVRRLPVSSRAEAAASHWLALQIRRRAKAFAVALDAAGTVYMAEALHAARIAGKKLRYTLELGPPSDPPTRRALARLERAQAALGRLHDLQDLQAALTRAAGQPRCPPSLLRQLDAWVDDLERDCRAAHADFIREAPALRRVVDQASRSAPLRLMRTRPRAMSASGLERRLRRGRRA